MKHPYKSAKALAAYHLLEKARELILEADAEEAECPPDRINRMVRIKKRKLIRHLEKSCSSRKSCKNSGPEVSHE